MKKKAPPIVVVQVRLEFMTTKQIHTTPQFRCGADISTTFCRKSPQHHRISN